LLDRDRAAARLARNMKSGSAGQPRRADGPSRSQRLGS
jgi:hypothetical protein